MGRRTTTTPSCFPFFYENLHSWQFGEPYSLLGVGASAESDSYEQGAGMQPPIGVRISALQELTPTLASWNLSKMLPRRQRRPSATQAVAGKL